VLLSREAAKHSVPTVRAIVLHQETALAGDLGRDAWTELVRGTYDFTCDVATTNEFKPLEAECRQPLDFRSYFLGSK
jgi:hypothetical protein